MSPGARRQVRLIHAWAGLVLSILLIVLGLSGTLLVFESDYLRATIPEARAPVDHRASTIGAALENIELHARDTGVGISYVMVAQDGMALHRVDFLDGSAAFTDQSGTVIKSWAINGSVEDWIFHLHHYLFLGDTGKNIAGLAGFAAIAMVLTGLVIVTPFLRNFAWRVWPRSGRRRALLGVHRDLGVLFAVPLLLLAFTGASLVFSQPVQALFAALTASEAEPFEVPVVGRGKIDWTRALGRASAAYPDARLRLVSWPRSANTPASIRLRQPAEWHQNGRTYAYVDPSTSEIVASRDAFALSRGERWFHTLYPLHSAGVGGRAYDIVVALTGLALALLGGLGAWAFVAQRRRLGRPETAQLPAST